MTDYPIPVKRLTGAQALTIICETCHAEAVIDPDDILNDDCYECPADTERGRLASTEPRCTGSACMKYWEGNECPGCGKLGWWDGYSARNPLKGCCSRRCMLQHEYALTLRGLA